MWGQVEGFCIGKPHIRIDPSADVNGPSVVPVNCCLVVELPSGHLVRSGQDSNSSSHIIKRGEPHLHCGTRKRTPIPGLHVRLDAGTRPFCLSSRHGSHHGHCGQDIPQHPPECLECPVVTHTRLTPRQAVFPWFSGIFSREQAGS